MKRLFSNRYPLYGENHNGIGKIALITGTTLSVIVGLLSLNKWRKTELAKRSIEKYQAVDPNKIVPLPEDLRSINSDKLLKAVTEGGDKFIYDELGYKLFASAEEYVYHTTTGLLPEERERFLEYVRDNISEL